MSTHLSPDATKWLNETYEKIKTKMYAQCRRVGSYIPYIPTDGKYRDLDTPNGDGIYWWTNGFWPGMLWQMYNATGEEIYRTAAEGVERRLDEALAGFEGLHHDVGFMWLHTSVANYRLTGNAESRRRGLHAANLMSGRYNPLGKFIRAWNADCTGWIIIDTLMNLPILYWAGLETNDPRFGAMAIHHADTCLANTVRPDGSCNHISILDPYTGTCMENPAGQGYASGSSWSRGHSWAVYGFALSYIYSKQERYLDVAKKVAHYFIANLAMGNWLPLIDFRAPKEPVKYDSTAAMCASCGLLEIARHVSEHEKPLYINAAINMLQACEKAFCNWNPSEDGIMGKGAGSYHGVGADSDAAIIYGDYFFVEAILRLMGKDFLIW